VVDVLNHQNPRVQFVNDILLQLFRVLHVDIDVSSIQYFFELKLRSPPNCAHLLLPMLFLCISLLHVLDFFHEFGFVFFLRLLRLSIFLLIVSLSGLTHVYTASINRILSFDLLGKLLYDVIDLFPCGTCIWC
jgi:hypothetical protein